MLLSRTSTCKRLSFAFWLRNEASPASQFAQEAQRNLQHSQPDNAVFDLTAIETAARDSLECLPVLLQIAEGLTLRLERRLQNAGLSG
jgi:hypothetical protein